MGSLDRAWRVMLNPKLWRTIRVILRARFNLTEASLRARRLRSTEEGGSDIERFTALAAEAC